MTNRANIKAMQDAAPEMLAALKDLLDAEENLSRLREIEGHPLQKAEAISVLNYAKVLAQAAIAKAEGR